MKLIRRINSSIERRAIEKKQIIEQSKYKIQFYNCWDQSNEDMYWRQFIESHQLNSDYNGNIAIFSVFGRRKMIDKVRADVKIFYSAENLNEHRFAEYADHCINNPNIDLAMGFEYLQNERYLRFPLWMDYMFDPWLTEDEIRKKCHKLRYPTIADKSKFCAMIISNPGDGLRKDMLEIISKIKPVCSAGKYLNNDDSLKQEFNDIKTDYLSNFYFNICPENSDAKGYVTEKLFECIGCGCIPIYWGSGGNPEPEVINQDAIIKWDRGNNGAEAVKTIESLINSPALLNDFIKAPRLNDSAEEYILDTYSSIRSKLERILCRK